MLQDWGKAVGDRFEGANLNNRLVKKSIVKKDGVNKDNEIVFSLTKKGELLADDLVIEIRNKT